MVSYVLFNIDTVRRCCLLETLQSDNGDKNVAEKYRLCLDPLILFCPYTKSPNYFKVGKLVWG